MMSLDVSKLENVRTRGGKMIARCPACAEAGHDQKGEHLVINADGRFGCVVYPGDSADAKAAPETDFRLVRRPRDQATGRTIIGFRTLRTGESNSFSGQPLKTGLLGRLGRVFETHLEREADPRAEKQRLNEREAK